MVSRRMGKGKRRRRLATITHGRDEDGQMAMRAKQLRKMA